MHRGLFHTESAEEVHADAESATDTCTGPGAHAGTYRADASPNAGADAGAVYGWLARLRRERGRDLLWRCERLGLCVRGGVRVHGGVLRRPRAAHVRAHDAGADACTDSFPEPGAHGSTHCSDPSPDTCADSGGVRGWFAWLRPE